MLFPVELEFTLRFYVQRVQRVQKVQRVVGKVLKIDRPVGRRVLKFDGPTGRGLWYRPAGDEFYKSASQNGKPNNRAAPVGNAPLSPYGDFPRRGKFALCSAFGLIRCEQHFGELAACAGHPLSGFAGLLHGKASHLVLRSLCSPTNPVPLPPRRGKSALCSAFGLIQFEQHFGD